MLRSRSNQQCSEFFARLHRIHRIREIVPFFRARLQPNRCCNFDVTILLTQTDFLLLHIKSISSQYAVGLYCETPRISAIFVSKVCNWLLTSWSTQQKDGFFLFLEEWKDGKKNTHGELLTRKAEKQQVHNTVWANLKPLAHNVCTILSYRKPLQHSTGVLTVTEIQQYFFIHNIFAGGGLKLSAHKDKNIPVHCYLVPKSSFILHGHDKIWTKFTFLFKPQQQQTSSTDRV